MEETQSKPPVPRKGKSFSTSLNIAVRWLHLYVSMFGFLAMFFFAVTGITLNHPTWFGEQTKTSTFRGQVNLDWLGSQVDKLRIAEFLRAQHRLRGMVKEFRVEDEECLLAYNGPGYSADVFIDRKSGDYEISVVEHGIIANWNDLHKGRDSGFWWSVIIDLSAAIMIISSLTGVGMLLFIKRKRFSGIVWMILGGITFALAVWLLVP